MVRSLMTFALVVVAVSRSEAGDERRFSVGILGGFAVEQPLNDYIPSDVQMGVAELQFTGTLIAHDGKPALDVVGAVFFSQSAQPGSRFTVGPTITLRGHLLPKSAFGVYLEAGAGHVTTGLRIIELNGHYQSLLQAGGGLRWRTGHSTLTLGYRWLHLSNDGTMLPNQGLNLNTGIVSYAFGL